MSKPRILVIDDEEIVRISCRKCLAPEGYEVDLAGSGAEGMRVLAETPYDLVLTDLKMPDMDGMEFLMKIKEARPGTKVIMITGYSTVEHAEEAMLLGACNYVEKPFTPDTLIRAVREALGEAGKRRDDA
ncbi:MAG: response regulator [Nitrospirae bacterium]|nr:response regulator [Nitrospirota bacterium]